MLLPGRSRPGVTTLVLDHVTVCSFMLLQSHACLASLILALDYAHTGLSLFMRSSQRVSSVVSPVGLACLDLVSSPPIVDSMQMGSCMSLRSFAHVDSALLISDHAIPGTSASIRSLARLSPATSTLDLGHFEPFLPPQARCRPDLAASVLGKAPLDFMVPIIELAKSEPSISLRSPARLDSALLALDCGAVGPSPFARQLVHLGSSASLLGLSRLGSVSSLPVVSSASFGSPLSPHSLARSGLLPSVLNYAHLEPTLLLQAMTQPGSSVSIYGVCSFQYAAAMPVLCQLTLGSQTLLRSFACLGLAISVVDFAHIGPSMFTRSSARTELSAFLTGLSRVGFSLLVILSTHPELSTFIKSFNHLEPSVLAMLLAHTGLPTSPRSHSCIGFAASAAGLCNSGSIFSPSVIDKSNLDSFLPTRSFAHCDFDTSVSDLLRPGPLSPVRAFLHVAPSAFVSGLACQGFVSLLPVTDSAHLGPLLLARSSSQFDSAILTLDNSVSGSLMLLHSFARLGPGALVLGGSRVYSPLLVLAGAHPDLPMLLKSFAHSGSAVLVLELVAPGSPLPYRSFAHVGLAAPIPGTSRIGSVFALPVVDTAMPGSLPSAHSPGRAGPVAPALDPLRPGSSSSIQSFSRLGFAASSAGIVRPGPVSSPSVTDAATLDPLLFSHACSRSESVLLVPEHATSGSPLSLRSMAKPASLVLIFGKCVELSMSISELGHPDSPLLLRSLAQLSLPILAPDLAHFGLSMLLRSSSKPGSMTSFFGLSRMGSVSSLPAFDDAMMGSSLPSRSFMRPNFTIPISDHKTVGSAMPPRASARVDPGVFAFQAARPSVSAPASDLAHAEPSLPLRSFAYLGLAPLILDRTHLDPSSPAQSFARVGSTVFAFGLTCMGFLFSPPVPDGSFVGSPLPPRSLARHGSPAPALEFMKPESSPLLRSSCKLDLMASLFGLVRIGSLSLLPATDDTMLGPSLSPRSFAHSEPFLPASDLEEVGSSMLTKSLLHPGSAVLVMYMSRMDLLFSLFVSSSAYLDPSVFLRSFAHLGSAVLALDCGHLDFSTPVRSLARSGPGASCINVLRVSVQVSILGATVLGSSTSLRSPAQLDSAALVPDHARLGSSASLRGSAKPGFTASVLGLTRPGPAFSLSAMDVNHLGSVLSLHSLSHTGPAPSILDAAFFDPTLPVRSLGHPASALPAFDLVHLGSCMSPHSSAHFGFSPFASGDTLLGSLFSPFVSGASHLEPLSSPRSFARPGPSPSAPDYATFGPTSPVQSPNQAESLSSALDLAHVDLATSTQSLLRSGSGILLLGCVRMGSLFLLPVTDAQFVGPSPSLRSPARVEALLPVLDHVILGSTSPVRSLACLEFSTLILDFTKFGSLSLVRSHARLDPLVPLLGMSRAGPVSSPLVTDSASLDSLPSLQAFACLSFPAPTSSFAGIGSLLFVRQPACLEPFVLMPSSARIGFLVLILGLGLLGFPLSMHSLMRLGPVLLVFDHDTTESFLSLRQGAQLGSAASIVGMARAGLIFLLPVAGCSPLGPSSLLRSLAQPGLVLLVVDHVTVGMPLPPRSFACPGLAALLIDLSRLNVSLPVADRTALGPSSSLRSFARPGSALLVLDIGHIGIPSFLHSFAHAESVASPVGLGRLGPVFPLPVVDASLSDSSSPLRSMAHPNSPAPMPDYSHLAFFLPPQGLARIGFSASMLGVMQVEAAVFALQNLHPGFSLFLRSHAQLELATSTLDLAHVGLPMFVRSSVRLELSVLLLAAAKLGARPPIFACSSLGSPPSSHSFS